MPVRRCKLTHPVLYPVLTSYDKTCSACRVEADPCRRQPPGSQVRAGTPGGPGGRPGGAWCLWGWCACPSRLRGWCCRPPGDGRLWT